MKIESTIDDSVTIIALAGRFDASVVAMFRKFVDDLEEKEQENYVVGSGGSGLYRFRWSRVSRLFSSACTTKWR